jgi:hypothetical protein
MRTLQPEHGSAHHAGAHRALGDASDGEGGGATHARPGPSFTAEQARCRLTSVLYSMLGDFCIERRRGPQLCLQLPVSLLLLAICNVAPNIPYLH